MTASEWNDVVEIDIEVGRWMPGSTEFLRQRDPALSSKYRAEASERIV